MHQHFSPDSHSQHYDYKQLVTISNHENTQQTAHQSNVQHLIFHSRFDEITNYHTVTHNYSSLKKLTFEARTHKSAKAHAGTMYYAL